MDSYIKKIPVLTFAMITGLFALSGCGERANAVTSVSIDKDGKITNIIYEEFDKDYYDLDELSDMAASEISEYNVEYSSPKVSLEKAELVEDGARARLSMSYESASDYSHFNQVSLFYGTVEEAVNKGYTISKSLVDASGNKIDEAFIDEHPDRHIIITTDKSNIKTPYNIEYMSNGVILSDKKEAVVSAVTTDTVQLLLSK